MSSGKQTGFTYLIALLLVAALGAGMAATASIWSHARQRDKEAELIWIGEQFRQAIGLYYNRSPGAVKRYPEKLEDLIEDRRFPSMQRYLRRIYVDPLTGKAHWGLVAAPEGGIMGIRSTAEGAPIRLLGTAKQYKGWEFVYTPQTVPASSSRR